jgi:hypothetical protein
MMMMRGLNEIQLLTLEPSGFFFGTHGGVGTQSQRCFFFIFFSTLLDLANGLDHERVDVICRRFIRKVLPTRPNLYDA